MPFTITRTHDFDAGHRVCGHESKCAHLHGHRYTVAFTVQTESLDEIGRIIDFSVIKGLLCQWLEDHWDHRMLLWCHDPFLERMQDIDPHVVALPLNPTAENLAIILLQDIGPRQLAGTGVTLVTVTVNETAKCSATFSLSK